MRLSKRMVTAVAIMGAVAILSPGTAHAATGGAAVAVVGSGTITPGLSATPTDQSVEFTGTAAGAAFAVGATPTVAVADAGAVSCAFSGTSSGPETSAAGTGTVTGTCTGAGLVLGTPVSADCTLDYYRAGPVVVVAGNCTVTGGGATVSTSTTAGVFLFVPGPSLPTTTYTLAGVAAGAGLN